MIKYDKGCNFPNVNILTSQILDSTKKITVISNCLSLPNNQLPCSMFYVHYLIKKLPFYEFFVQFLSQLQKRQCHWMSKLPRNYTLSHASKVMLKILQARLQPYVNCELPDIQAGFRKGRRTREDIASIHWIIKKARQFHKNIYFCFINYTKAFDFVVHNKLWKILKDGNTRQPDLPPEKSVCRSRSKLELDMEQTDWFQIRKGVCQGCILSPCLFNLYAEYIMQNAKLDEA